MQDVVLALLVKQPSHGYDLRRRLSAALGPLGESLNAGQVYVTLTRLERAGLVAHERDDVPTRGPRRKVYALTPAGRNRVAEWLAEPAGLKTDVTEFHLKLVAAAASGQAEPPALVGEQRRALMRGLAEIERAALAHELGSEPWLLLEGIALRMQADLRWLDVCERVWSARGGKAEE